MRRLLLLVFACTPSATAVKVPETQLRPFARLEQKTGNAYSDRFLELWNDIHDPKNGYFSSQGIPYHSVETLMCEAPDYGHETTSEAYSYWIWLEALYGRVTKDYTWLQTAWTNLETNIVPQKADQPTVAYYNPGAPAQFAPELDRPEQYPASLDANVPVGSDPIAPELTQSYGESDVYGMHWLLDVDNWYGFGRRADGTGKPAYINTFQRGPQESVFEAIPQPSWDDMKFGGAKGYLDLFGSAEQPQWRYSVAPDADARAIQAIYWA